MAELFGSAIEGELLNKAASILNGNYEIPKEVKDKLERLEELLIMIQSAVEAADGRQIKNLSLLRWLRRFKDAAYYADDVLDTFEYRLLEQKANEDDDKVSSSFASSSSNVAKRVRTAARSLSFCDEDVKELSSAVEKLERIATDLVVFIKLLKLEGSYKKPEITNRRITSTLQLQKESPVGREREKEDIINLLLQPESGAAGNISVIPILGIGGVGKTTLVQLVCKDERVKQHFSPIMWVCVSNIFDLVSLTKSILEQCHPNFNPGDHAQSQCNWNPGDVENFNSLQYTLKEKIRSKRFLLILDDVWNENERTVWEKLLAPLLPSRRGSKIIVTSRLRKVAEVMGTVNPIELQGLPNWQYLSFFEKCAFGDVDPDEHPKLLNIGMEIAQRLKGSPLAAKTVGALLKGELKEEHWKSILKSDLWELKQGEDDIMPALMLSYQHLPVHLQRCFAYCSVFPKDWEFKRDDMIYMWIAEGFIPNNNGKKRVEYIGEEYFKILISNAFFQVAESYTRTEKIEVWKVHDLLHDLAESVSKDVCYRIDSDETQKIPDSVRHLSVMTARIASLTNTNLHVLKHLRTLNFLFNSKTNLNVTDLRDVLEKVNNIRVLNLVNCHLEELPISSCNMIHLRFLNLYSTGLKELPSKLCDFYHLERLILTGLELNGLPRSMNKLIKLRHFIEDQERTKLINFPCKIDEQNKPLVSEISGIGKMTCLQELKLFCVEEKSGFEIRQLKYLRELRGSLKIRNLETVRSKKEAMDSMLSDKVNIVKLKLSWCDTPGDVRYDTQEEEVLEGLQPHSKIEELKVVGYRGVQSPSWLMTNHYLRNLVELVLHGCQKWKELPPFGQLPSLERLELHGMHAVEEIGCGFSGSGVVKGFPLLKKFSLHDFPELKEWRTIEEDQLFPCLDSFTITNCLKLMALPSLPPAVSFLNIQRVGITLPPKFRRQPYSSSPYSLYVLMIADCPRLENIDEWSRQEVDKFSQLGILHLSFCPSVYLLSSLLEIFCIVGSSIEAVELSRCLQYPVDSLTSLEIIECPHLTSLPSIDVLQRFINLSDLCIHDCAALRSLGGLKALDSLRYLHVSKCPKLTSLVADQVEEVVEEELGLSSFSDGFDLHIDNPLLLKVLLSREGLTSLKHLEIVGVDEFTTFTTEMEEAFQQLTNLHWLGIRYCNTLQRLPTCLKYLSCIGLYIDQCPNIQTLPCKEALPPSLEILHASNCHPALKERYKEGGPDRHTIAHISHIEIF